VVGDHGVLDEVAANGEDASAALRLEVRTKGLDGVEGAAHGDLRLGGEISPGEGLQGCARVPVEGKIGEGVVDEHGGRAEGPRDLRDHGKDRVPIGEVSGKGGGAGTEFRGEGFCRGGAPAVVEGHAGPLPGEGPGKGGPETAARPGDQDGLVCERGSHGNRGRMSGGVPGRSGTGVSSRGERCRFRRLLPLGRRPPLSLTH